MTPRVMPLLGRHGCEVVDAVIEVRNYMGLEAESYSTINSKGNVLLFPTISQDTEC